MTQQLPLGAVKNGLSEVVDRVEREHDRVVITKHGRPAAVLISVDDLAELEETLAILGDREIMDGLTRSAAEVEAGEIVTLTKEQALAELRGE